MCIKPGRKSEQGFTLIEVLVASGIFAIAAAAIMTLFSFSTRTFAAMANYAKLDQINRTALDKLTKELRQTYHVNYVTTNSITFLLPTNTASGYISVTYRFNPPPIGNLVRTVADGSQPPQVLLQHCTLVNFETDQRTPIDGTFDQYPAAQLSGDGLSARFYRVDGTYDEYSAETAPWTTYVKVVRLTWYASLPVPGGGGLSENVQTARVVLRQQKEPSSN
jgi:prepilin-type N-terminal cleavage/methylation domain-containing protein